jgi:hypothetical protein
MISNTEVRHLYTPLRNRTTLDVNKKVEKFGRRWVVKRKTNFQNKAGDRFTHFELNAI